MLSPAPFAALEADLATTVFAHVANAVVVIGATEVSGTLDQVSVDAFDHVAGTRVVFECPTASIASLVAQGDVISISGTSYEVKQIDLDAGVSRLHLKDVP